MGEQDLPRFASARQCDYCTEDVALPIAPGSSTISGERDGIAPSGRPETGGVGPGLNGSPAATSKEMRDRRAQEAEEDRALIERAQRGDTAAFRQIVEKYERRAVQLAMTFVHDENDARELAQEAFLRVYKHLQDFHGGSTFFTWLYRIITNLGIDFTRRPGHRFVALDANHVDDVEDEDHVDLPTIGRLAETNPADVVRRREIASRIQIALDALPSYHRSVIIMREIDGLSYDEIAEATGVSKGTIMSRLFHARHKLQRALAGYYEEQVGAREPVSELASAGEDP